MLSILYLIAILSGSSFANLRGDFNSLGKKISKKINSVEDQLKKTSSSAAVKFSSLGDKISDNTRKISSSLMKDLNSFKSDVKEKSSEIQSISSHWAEVIDSKITSLGEEISEKVVIFASEIAEAAEKTVSSLKDFDFGEFQKNSEFASFGEVLVTGTLVDVGLKIAFAVISPAGTGFTASRLWTICKLVFRVLGFQKDGIRSDSFAAKLQSLIHPVEKRSLFAILTAIGMKGGFEEEADFLPILLSVMIDFN
jgi:gas vesicle protein